MNITGNERDKNNKKRNFHLVIIIVNKKLVLK